MPSENFTPSKDFSEDDKLQDPKNTPTVPDDDQEQPDLLTLPMDDHDSFEIDLKSGTNGVNIRRRTRRNTTQFENLPDLAQWVDQAKEKSHAATVYVSN